MMSSYTKDVSVTSATVNMNIGCGVCMDIQYAENREQEKFL